MGVIKTGNLDNPTRNDFELGQVDTFTVDTNVNPGVIRSIQFKTSSTDGWNVQHVGIT